MRDPGPRRPGADRLDRHGVHRSRHAGRHPALTYGLYAQVSAAGGAQRDARSTRRRARRSIWRRSPPRPATSARGWCGCAIPTTRPATLIDAGRLARVPGSAARRLRGRRRRGVHGLRRPEPARAAGRPTCADGRPVIVMPLVLQDLRAGRPAAGLRASPTRRSPACCDIVQEPFNVNRIALAAGRAAVAVPGFVERRRAEVAEAREVLARRAGRAPASRSHPSQANFVLVELGTDDRPVCDRLLRRGLLIRGGTRVRPARLRAGHAWRRAPVMRRAAAEIADGGPTPYLGVCRVMVYQLTETLVADRIAELLQREGAEFIVGFPENRLLNSASLIGMRPIITRTERVAVNIADGFARATNGERHPALRHPVRARRGVGIRRRRPGLRRPQPDPALSQSSMPSPTRTRRRTSGSRRPTGRSRAGRQR